MKISKLIEELKMLPQDDEIVMFGEYDSIMGDQGVNEDIMIDKEIIHGRITKKGYIAWETSISNTAGGIKKEVWVLR
jgi:hypothetical protein